MTTKTQTTTDKITRNERGELFIQTSDRLWASRLAHWKANQSLPMPMPERHHMFGKGRYGHYKAVTDYQPASDEERWYIQAS